MTSAAFDPSDDKTIGACFPCAARGKACSRGKIRRMDAPDRARPVRLVEDEDGVVRVVREGMLFEQARQVVLPDKIQDKDGERVVHEVEDRGLESGEIVEGDKKNEDEEMAESAAEGLEVGTQRNKIQDKEVQRVNLRVPLRARVKSTYVARSAVVKNKIQDKVPERERARGSGGRVKRPMR